MKPWPRRTRKFRILNSRPSPFPTTRFSTPTKRWWPARPSPATPRSISRFYRKARKPPHENEVAEKLFAVGQGHALPPFSTAASSPALLRRGDSSRLSAQGSATTARLGRKSARHSGAQADIGLYPHDLREP